jgi:hypothetical protein
MSGIGVLLAGWAIGASLSFAVPTPVAAPTAAMSTDCATLNGAGFDATYRGFVQNLQLAVGEALVVSATSDLPDLTMELVVGETHAQDRSQGRWSCW